MQVDEIKYTSCVEGQTKIDTVLWTLFKFTQLLANKTPKEYRTAKFEEIEEDTESKFKLKIQFLGRENDVIEIYYRFPNAIFLKTVLTCLKRFEERSIVMIDYHKIEANKWQYLATLFKRDVTTYEGKDLYLLVDGSLRLKFQFFVSTDVKVAHTNVPEAELSNDLENLLDNGLFSDVTMKSVEGNEYKVHKAILASRSVVLKAHFEHNTLECHTNIIESPFDSTILSEVLKFIYSDQAPRVDEKPEKLLAAADFYELGRLKSLCEEALQKKLTVHNVLETLELADLHSAKLLKQLTLEFIKDGQAKLITKTEGWAKVKSVEIVKSIYEFIMDDEVDGDIK